VATDNTKRKSKLQGGTVELKPVPPGTKSRGKLWRPGDPEPLTMSARRFWLVIGATATAALAVGAAIGRYLLP
jgi:hypothetical protein